MNLDQAIIEEIYNIIHQHLPNEYQEMPLDPGRPIKRISAKQPEPRECIYLHRYAAAIQITTAHTYTYIYVDNGIIIIRNTITTSHINTIAVTQHEIANPNTNIFQIAQTILNISIKESDRTRASLQVDRYRPYVDPTFRKE